MRTIRLSELLKYTVVVLLIYFTATIFNTGTQVTMCQSRDHNHRQKSADSHVIIHPPRAVRVVDTTSRRRDVECQPVHVVTWCHDVDTTRDVVSMLHTLLYHRTSALQLHLVVSNSSHTTLKLLFDTWQLPNVTTHFYLQTDIDVQDQSQNYILAQLPAILPDTLTKVIYASYNVRFLDDITSLWKAFDTSKYWLVALPRSTQPDVSEFEWAAYQYDLAVVNLQQAAHTLDEFVQVMRAQESRPEVVRPISCSWSIPINLTVEEPSDWDPCLERAKAVLWNTNATQYSGNPLAEDAKQRIINILDSNGDLQRTTFLCGGIYAGTFNSSSEKHPTDECAEYTHIFRSTHRVHLNFLGTEAACFQPHGNFDISIATQFSADRLYMFEKFAQNWEGPIVAVVYATDAEARELVTGVEWSETLRDRENIAYHVVYKKKYYPINLLRNLALNHTKTPYVLFVDVDLIPMPTMYSLLKGRLRELWTTYKDKKAALVIPAFQSFERLTTIPENKKKLLGLWSKGIVEGYRMREEWNRGHHATNFPRWRTYNSLYVVEYDYCFEPYVVLPVKDVPLYHEPLLDRMQDKIAYGILLDAMGYVFVVQPDAFVVHLPHPLSESIMLTNHIPSYSMCGDQFIEDYRSDVKKLYGHRPRPGDGGPVPVVSVNHQPGPGRVGPINRVAPIIHS